MKIKLKNYDMEQRSRLEKAGYRYNGFGLEKSIELNDIRVEMEMLIKICPDGKIEICK